MASQPHHIILDLSKKEKFPALHMHARPQSQGRGLTIASPRAASQDSRLSGSFWTQNGQSVTRALTRGDRSWRAEMQATR